VIWCLNAQFGNGTWQTRLTSMSRNSRQHRKSLWRLAIAEGGIWSKKPRPRRDDSSRLVCISSPWYFFYSPWWWVDTEDGEKGTSGHWSTPMMARCDPSTDFLVGPFSFTISPVDPPLLGTGWVKPILSYSHRTGQELTNHRYDNFVNHEFCNCRSVRP